MRILAVGNAYPPHHIGGYEVIWQGLMHHLRAEGHQTRILTTDHRSLALAESAEEDPDVHRQLDWYWRDHQWVELSPLRRLALERRNAAVFDRHLREFKPQVITWWAVGGMSLSLIERARRKRIPALFFVIDYWPAYGPQRDLWLRMWRSRPRAAGVAGQLTGIPTEVSLAEAGRWLFCSSVVEQDTLRTGLAISDRGILPVGIEDGYLQVPREPVPRQWSWRLLYIGRVVEQKGVDTAVESLTELPAEASLTIIGEGDRPYRQKLGDLAQRLGVSDRVRFEGPRPRSQLIEAYRDADAVVFPVRWPEPWGLVPLEAMALGRPVLATGTGGSGDYLVNESNCLLFGPDDAPALAAAARRLAEDEALRDRLREGGYRTAAEHSAAKFHVRAEEEIARAVGIASPPP